MLIHVSDHWSHGDFCFVVTKRLLGPRELKPPPSLVGSGAIASWLTHGWASFQDCIWSDSEPAAKRASPTPTTLSFQKESQIPSCEDKGTIVPREDLLESNAGSPGREGIHCLVTVWAWGSHPDLGRSAV